MSDQYYLFGEPIGFTIETLGIHTGEAVSKKKDIPTNADTIGGTYTAADIASMKNSIDKSKMKLLWENEDPSTSNFPAQTITLGLANYDYVKIFFNYAGSDGLEESSIDVKIGRSFTMSAIKQGDTVSRKGTTSNTGITFETGYGLTSENVGRCIPVAIYGCRFASLPSGSGSGGGLGGDGIFTGTASEVAQAIENGELEDGQPVMIIDDFVEEAEVESIEAQIAEINESLSNCFTSVSNGKTLVASAITDKGVTTASDATFATMAKNIKKIVTGVTPTISIAYYSESTNGVYNLTVGKTYAVAYGRSGNSYTGYPSSGTVLAGTMVRNTQYSNGLYMGIIKATSSSITFEGSDNCAIAILLY